MKLIGMLDSPYVRRVHITLGLLGLPFEHQSLSVFRDFDAFRRINPVVKAPTLLTDDGRMLIDSTLIIDYAESLVAAERRLLPLRPATRAQALEIIGFALSACDKTAAIVYERQLRPADKQHQPWLERLEGQLLGAYTQAESLLQAGTPCLSGAAMTQADITAAVAWRFTQHVLPDALDAERFPAFVRLSQYAERQAAFIAAPL